MARDDAVQHAAGGALDVFRAVALPMEIGNVYRELGRLQAGRGKLEAAAARGGRELLRLIGGTRPGRPFPKPWSTSGGAPPPHRGARAHHGLLQAWEIFERRRRFGMGAGRPYTGRMVRVRGIAFIGAMQFVKEQFGPQAHQRVVDALPESHRATFATPLRDAVWRPLEDLAAYAGTARHLLAPEEPDFYVRLGFRAGRVERDEGGFHPMVADARTAIRLGAVIWRSLYDVGRMELVADGEKRAVARIHDFPTTPALCQANCAALSGLLGSDERPVHTEQAACVLDGAAFCEYRISWGPARSGVS